MWALWTAKIMRRICRVEGDPRSRYAIESILDVLPWREGWKWFHNRHRTTLVCQRRFVPEELTRGSTQSMNIIFGIDWRDSNSTFFLLLELFQGGGTIQI